MFCSHIWDQSLDLVRLNIHFYKFKFMRYKMIRLHSYYIENIFRAQIMPCSNNHYIAVFSGYINNPSGEKRIIFMLIRQDEHRFTILDTVILPPSLEYFESGNELCLKANGVMATFQMTVDARVKMKLYDTNMYGESVEKEGTFLIALS